MKKVFIVIPAYNEEKTIYWVVKKAKKYGSVTVIDDASTDETSLLAKKAGARVIKHKTNSGLGSSLRTGFSEAIKKKADIVITIDADGQHDPEDIPRFINEIKKGYEFVLGSRNLSRYPFVKRFGNFFLNSVTNFISGTNLKDTESGFRAITGESLGKFYLKAEKYEIAVEIVFEVGRSNLRANNIPIDSPIYVKGVGVMDGFKNFIFLMHRRERNWKSYLEDFRYVIKKWV